MEQTKARAVKIAVIGCGEIAACHMRAYAKDRSVRLTGCCDIDAAKAQACAAQFGARAYDSVEALFEQQRDLGGVSICTYPPSHARLAVAALKRGVNVLCEKPLATSVREAKRVVNAERKSRAFLMLGYPFRFRREMLEVKRLLGEGTIGKPLFAHNAFSTLLKEIDQTWLVKKAIAGGGVVLDNGSHSIDLFHFLFGRTRRVSARTGRLRRNIDVEDTALLLLEMDNGLTGTIELSWSVPYPREHYLEIYGTEGTIQAKLGEVRWRNLGSPQWVSIKDTGEFQDGFDNEVAHFLECVRHGTYPSVGPTEGLWALEVIDAIYHQNGSR